jgi:protein involved in polysaccharide export with SLBB domain
MRVLPERSSRDACFGGGLRCLRPLILLGALLAGGVAQAQPLPSPSLPPALPGGLALPSLPPEVQQQILQRILDASGGQAVPPAPGLGERAARTPRSAPELTPPEPTEPLSGAEAFFAARLELPVPLRQFGYAALRPGPAGPPLLGALPDGYVIGRDDEVVVILRGRARATHRVRVGRDGLLVLPDLPPIPAAGRRLRDLRAEIAERASRELGGSEAFVSIGEIRQMGVLVAGEAERPGVVALPAIASVLDAILAAGGVTRSGSLRSVRVDGPAGSRRIDLYAVVAGQGETPDLVLREGERVVIPPLGPVVAIGGDVTRPGIYELPPGSDSAPLAAVLALAGDALRPAGNRFLRVGTDAGGRRSFTEIGPEVLLRRGDAVLVQPSADVPATALRLVGHVTAPITRSSAGRPGLRSLLADPRVIRPDPYVRMGVVWRVDAATRVRHFLPFDLGRVLSGAANLTLSEGDEVILLGQADVLWLASPPVQRALRGEAPEAEAGCPALQALSVAARASPQRFAHARGAGFPDLGTPPCPPLFTAYPTLLVFLLDNAVLIGGEARLPGLYPILNNTGLDQVLAAAGGVADSADLSAVEFAREPTEAAGTIALRRSVLDLRSRRFGGVRLSPRDTLRIPRGFGDREVGPVTLVGEFVRPGTYDIRRGERLSELIARAGGLSPQAYPYGAVFTRESVRQRQQEGFIRSARELEQSLLQVAGAQGMIAAGGRSGGDLGAAITAGRELAAALRDARAAGRMVVEVNPVILAARPEFDVLLEPGDLIAIPKRPNEVTVVGAVLNPGSLQFQSGWRAAEYVRAAGDLQRFADSSRGFVILPNGQSAPAGLSGWQSGGPPVPPGSVVVVPQDPSPFERWGFMRDVTQLLTQVSISAAALAVIARSR